MKLIVVYQSSTGFTKQYAEWIAQALNVEVISNKDSAKINVADYDAVIFGGWIMGNTIMGLDKLKQRNPKKLIVFACGSSEMSEETVNTILELNKLGDVPFFYMPGGFKFDQLNFFVRFMLKKMKKSVAKKENKTEQDRYMEKVLGTNFDISDRKYIEPLVAYYKREEK